jgi:hypothetical protein
MHGLQNSHDPNPFSPRGKRQPIDRRFFATISLPLTGGKPGEPGERQMKAVLIYEARAKNASTSALISQHEILKMAVPML